MKLRNMSQHEAQAITRLRTNEDFGIFMNYVGHYGEDIVQTLLSKVNLERPDHTRGCGYAVTQVIDAVEKAPKVLTQFEQRD